MSEYVWKNIQPQDDWSVNQLLLHINMQTSDIVSSSFEIESWKDMLFLTWDREISQWNFNLESPWKTVKFKNDSLSVDCRYSSVAKRAYEDIITITTTDISAPKASSNSIAGCKITSGYKIKLPHFPFMEMCPVETPYLITVTGTNKTVLSGQYADDYSYFEVNQDYTKTSGVWKIVYKYTGMLLKSCLPIDDIGLCMLKEDSYLWRKLLDTTSVSEQVYTWASGNEWELFKEESAIFPDKTTADVYWDGNYYFFLKDILIAAFNLNIDIGISKNTHIDSSDEILYSHPTYINLYSTRTLLGMSWTDRRTGFTAHAELVGRYGSDSVLSNDLDLVYWDLVTVKLLPYDDKDSDLNANLQKMGFNKVGHKQYTTTDGSYYHAYIENEKPYLEFYATTELYTSDAIGGAYFDDVFYSADHGVFTFNNGSKICFNKVQFVEYDHVNRNLNQIIQSQDNYLRDTVQFQEKADNNINEIVSVDYVDSQGKTISKEVLQNYSNLTTISKYYVDNQSFQVLSFEPNRKNKNNVNRLYCFDSSNPQKFGGTALCSPDIWTTVPQIYPEIVFNNTDGTNNEKTITITENSITVGDVKHTLCSQDVVIRYTRNLGVVSPEDVTYTFWNPTSNSNSNPTRNLINLSLKSSYEPATIRVEQVLEDGSYNTIESNSEVYNNILQALIQTTSEGVVSLYVRGVSDHIGEKSRHEVFQFGRYSGYTQDTWEEHCDVTMKLSGQIPYIGMKNDKTFNDIINYRVNYNPSISGQCTTNGSMKAYIPNSNSAELWSQFECANGTLPDFIPFFKEFSFSTRNPSASNDDYYHIVTYSENTGVYQSIAKKHFWTYGGPVDQILHTFNMEMYFKSKNTPTYAQAIVIWRNLKPYLGA